ncbi:MAG: TRAP transporter large permease subunit [Cryobacterium sp.]|nr:TRAP transporter large permease subunit [Cryobacterium sp.]
MTIEVALIVATVVLLALIVMRAPVALGILVGASVGIILYDGFDHWTSLLQSVFYSSSAKYLLFVIPMYVLLGSIVSNTDIGVQVYRVVNKAVGRLPGGLGATAVVATAMFSGISGSSAADITAFGRVSIREMTRLGYPRDYATAIVAAAGTFAVLIPPNLALVIYAVLAEVSVGAMIVAGLVPGIISVVVLGIFVLLRAPHHIRKPEQLGAQLAQAAENRRNATEPLPTLKEVTQAIDYQKGDWLSVVYVVILGGVVVGGLYGGFFTPTEAGAVAALVACFLMFTALRKGTSTRLRTVFGRSLRDTVDITSMIFLLFIGGSVFAYFLASGMIPPQLTAWAAGLDIPPLLLVAFLLIILLPLGAVLDGMSIMLLTVPSPGADGRGPRLRRDLVWRHPWSSNSWRSDTHHPTRWDERVHRRRVGTRRRREGLPKDLALHRAGSRRDCAVLPRSRNHPVVPEAVRVRRLSNPSRDKE